MRAIAPALCSWTFALFVGCVAGCVVGVDGRLILSDDDQRQAITRLEAALARKPGDWLLTRRIGLGHFSLKEYARAQERFLEVQALAPGEPISSLYLGLARIGKGEREAGLDLLSAYRWPGKFYHQQYVREEAVRLRRHPELPAGEIIQDILDALAAGTRHQDEVERDMFRGSF